MKTNRPNRTKEEMLFSGAGRIKCHQRIDLDRGSEFHSSAESIHHTVLYCSVQQRNVTAQQSHSEAFVLTGDCAGNCEIYLTAESRAQKVASAELSIKTCVETCLATL